MINLDRILLEEVGQFGRYQMVMTAFISLIVIFFTFASGEYEYTTAEIPHRCRITACEGLPSDIPHPEFRPDWLLNAINGESLNEFESCTRFAYSAPQPPSNYTCPGDWFNRTSEVACDGYVYENTNSAVYDFDLACDDWRRTILDSYTTMAIFQFLMMIATWADTKGRRSVLIISVFIAGCLGFVRSFITSYIWFLILRLLQIGLGCNTFSLCYILGIEMAGPNYRATVGAILSTMIPLAQIILSVMALLVKSWRTLLLIIFTPQILVITYFWIIPESVRWLICKEQFTESEAILKKMAKVNRNQLSDKSIFDLKAAAATTKTNDGKKPFIICVILKTPGILPRIFTNLLWFATQSVSQYIMDGMTGDLVDQSYFNRTYIKALAIPGIWTAAFLLNRIGRKKAVFGSFVSCAACQLAIAFIPQGGSVLSFIIYMFGTYFLAILSTSINLYSVELFPTEHRSFIFAYFYLHTILGDEIGPYIVSIGSMSWMGLPPVLMCCLALISAFLVKFSPETRDTKLPDTMEEASRIGKEKRTRSTQSDDQELIRNTIIIV